MEVKNRRVQPEWRSNANTKSDGYTYRYADDYTNCDTNTNTKTYSYSEVCSYAKGTPDTASETVAESALLL